MSEFTAVAVAEQGEPYWRSHGRRSLGLRSRGARLSADVCSPALVLAAALAAAIISYHDGIPAAIVDVGAARRAQEIPARGVLLLTAARAGHQEPRHRCQFLAIVIAGYSAAVL